LEGVPDESVDLIASCPPYWTLEKYGQTEGQLSIEPTYESFLGRIRELAKNAFRVLKPGKYAALVVADFRAGGKRLGSTLRLFHRDVLNIFEGEKLVPHDVVCIKLFSPFSWAQISKVARHHVRYTSKCTEYLLVFRKPALNEP
jgi:hypothetical protein